MMDEYRFVISERQLRRLYSMYALLQLNMYVYTRSHMIDVDNEIPRIVRPIGETNISIYLLTDRFIRICNCTYKYICTYRCIFCIFIFFHSFFFCMDLIPGLTWNGWVYLVSICTNNTIQVGINSNLCRHCAPTRIGMYLIKYLGTYMLF